MIVLDTDVLSALMRPDFNRVAVDWLDRQPSESIWITSITLFEIRLGLAVQPAGRKQRALEAGFESVLADDLENRVLDFDRNAAMAAAGLAARRRRAGRTVDFRDTQIAGIALSKRASVATRNVRHFGDLDVPVVNPWADRVR